MMDFSVRLLLPFSIRSRARCYALPLPIAIQNCASACHFPAFRKRRTEFSLASSGISAIIPAGAMLNQEVITRAEAAAVQIPAGNAVILPEGSRVYVTQMLGNSVTAASDMGLVRITQEEAVRAGIVSEPGAVDEKDEDLTLEERVWKTLGNIYDPEIPVDIVNLGLVYGVEIIPQKEGGSVVQVQMTLTAPGCGMGPHLMAEAEMNIAALDGVSNVDIEFVWDPPWNQDMMTEEARMQLGMI